MGGNMRRVSAIAERFRPDAIISDFEPYLSHIARARNIPLLAINHQNFLTENGLPASLPHNVRVSPINRERFLEDLSRCRALISTAGNQVIGEAIYLSKPVLAFPEPDVLEQELNALALSRSGLGTVFKLQDFHPDLLDAFQNEIPIIVARMQGSQARRRTLDGKTQALRALRRFLIEFGGGSIGHGRPHPATRGGERRMPILSTRERKPGLAVT